MERKYICFVVLKVHLSASLALEKKMLDVMDVFAIFPCP